MTQFADIFQKNLVRDVINLIEEGFELYKSELKNQGHVNTGKLLNSGEVRTTIKGTTVVGELLLNDYFEYLERRLSPDRVPYSRGSGKKTSKVVTALKKYFRQKGLNDTNAQRAAFATLNKWKQEGRPTKASRRFAVNNRRLRPLGIVLDELEGKIERLLEQQTTKNLEIIIDRIGEGFSRQIV
jgi:hypothetical protein